MRQDQKEYRELARLLGFCSVLKDVWGVENLGWLLVFGSEIAHMKLPDRSSQHHLPYIPKDGSPRDKAGDASKGCDWSLVGKGNSGQVCTIANPSVSATRESADIAVCHLTSPFPSGTACLSWLF